MVKITGSPGKQSERTTRDERMLRVVETIPRGRVATYGQVAALAGYSRHARHVGAALRGADDDRGVPWHRVVSAGGRIVRRGNDEDHLLQRMLLEAEGVEITRSDRVDLTRFGWDPDDRAGGSKERTGKPRP